MKKLLQTLVVVVFIGFLQNLQGQIPSYVPNTSLLGWWNLNTISSNQAINLKNSSGYMQTSLVTTSTERDGCYYFSGQTNCYLAGGSTIQSSNFSNYTWSFWIKTTQQVNPTAP